MQDSSQAPADSDYVEEAKACVALNGFFGIAQQWGCDDAEQAALLGYEDPGSLQQFKNASALKMPASLLERISLLFGIYHALGTLYPSAPLANAAIRRPRNAPPFDGASPLTFMMRGNVERLRQTRRYFEAQLQG